jgi:ferric-dicitrate binding protein FerR (iron transport regulator)
MSRFPISSPDEQDEAMDTLGRIARMHLTGTVSAQEEAEARRRWRAHLANQPFAESMRRKIKLGLGAAAMAAVVAAIFVGRPLLRRPALTFDVDIPVVSERDYLLVPSTAPSGHVVFSDGSKLTLAPGGRGRIVALHADGAEIGLEDGRASLEVAHRAGARWLVAAGPFAISVTGTTFDVRWSGADELFELDMRSGSVTIRGPLAAAGIELAAGQKLVADLRANQLRIERLIPETRDESSTQAVETTPSESAVASAMPRGLVGAAASARDLEGAPRARAARREATDDAKPSWAQRVAAGDFRGVLADAEQRGLENTLAQNNLADLVALADAARYASRVDIAHRALLVQRERFGGSTAARTAAFLLGRLADTRESQPAAAIGWYDRYLAEAPSGEFASEALGRKLVAVQRVSGAASARPIAQEYLRRFPQGPYAAKAHELTLSP